MKQRKVLNFIAYIVVCLIAVAFLLRFLAKTFSWGETFVSVCSSVAFYLGLFVTICSAFLYATSKRNSTYLVVLIVLLIVILVLIFI